MCCNNKPIIPLIQSNKQKHKSDKIREQIKMCTNGSYCVFDDHQSHQRKLLGFFLNRGCQSTCMGLPQESSRTCNTLHRAGPSIHFRHTAKPIYQTTAVLVKSNQGTFPCCPIAALQRSCRQLPGGPSSY